MTADPDRIFSRVQVSHSGCWLYLGGRNSKGYGVVSVSNRSVATHRLAYQLRIGPIPDELAVMHRCDTPACINPDHLALGTKGDNNTDRKRKGRNADRRGERNTQAKLTPRVVSRIRRLYGAGRHSQQAIADLYGICQQTVSNIVRGQLWPHLDARSPIVLTDLLAGGEG